MRLLKDIIYEDFKLTSKGKISKQELKEDLPPKPVNDVIYELGEYISYIVHDYGLRDEELDACLYAWAHEKPYMHEKCQTLDDEIKHIIEHGINNYLHNNSSYKTEFDADVLMNSNQWTKIRNEFIRIAKFYL